jgi:hypothetical protein
MHTLKVTEKNIVKQKMALRKKAIKITDDVRKILGAPRSSEMV